MTQHLLQRDIEEDKRTLKRVAKVIGLFVVATAILAVSVGLIMN